MTAFCAGSHAAPKLLRWLVPALFVAVLGTRAVAADTLTVKLDEARIVRMPDRAATVVIGNPMIADLTMQPGNLAVVTGKAYGATNVIVLDRSGAVLTELELNVTGPRDKTVIVYRGIARETYSCTPQCSPRITLGDDNTYFTNAVNQSSTRNTQAIAAGADSTH